MLAEVPAGNRNPATDGINHVPFRGHIHRMAGTFQAARNRRCTIHLLLPVVSQCFYGHTIPLLLALTGRSLSRLVAIVTIVAGAVLDVAIHASAHTDVGFAAELILVATGP